jgi:hypothetical protein
VFLDDGDEIYDEDNQGAFIPPDSVNFENSETGGRKLPTLFQKRTVFHQYTKIQSYTAELMRTKMKKSIHEKEHGDMEMLESRISTTCLFCT